MLVEVPIPQIRQLVGQDRGQFPDVDHRALRRQILAPQLQLDDVGGAVQLLGRAERRIGQAMGDHDVIADRQVEHVDSSPFGP